MAIDPNIALGVKPFEVANPLAQYAQVAQLQTMQRQGEVSQMQLDSMKRDRDMLAQISAKAAAHGGPSDPNEIANAYISSGNPEFVKFGLTMQEKLQGQKMFTDYLKSKGFNAPAAGAPAPMGNAPAPMAAAPVNAMAPMGGAPVNAMAPRPAMAPTPVNALANEQTILNDIRMLSASNDPRAKAEVDVLKTQLTELRKIPTEVREFQYAQSNPAFEQYQMRLKRAGAANVNMPPQERAEQGARGTMLVKQYEGLSNAAALATKTLPSIDANLGILNNGFDTGFGTATKKAGASVLAALGVKDAEKYATDSQSFLSNATQAVLQKQLEQKGPQTESDAQRIDQTGAELGKTKRANEFVLSVAKAQFKRDIEQRNFYDTWWKNNKTYDGAENAWYQGDGGKSLFSRPELSKYIKAPGAAAGATIPAPKGVDANVWNFLTPEEQKLWPTPKR